ncbi:RnfABCDGE type electron transport complex subunit D [Candidatus Dependentiae bacterium]|nr:RnfABCDGE type electron transport complex subunit D [Candidatus Dependentiae bacterium]
MLETNNSKIYEVSASPHSIKPETIKSVMFDVLIALIPAVIAAFVFFRWSAVYVMGLTILFCVGFEYIFSKLLLKKNTVSDLSCVVTGLLLAMNLPSNVPWWIMLVGSFFSIVIGKLVFGGIGQNPFNPALVGRVVLLVSWPAILTTWPKPQLIKSVSDIFRNIDSITSATPLGILKEKGVSYLSSSTPHFLYSDLYFGYCGGSLGEISAFALIIGGIYLLYKGHITLHIPLSFIISVLIISGIFWFTDNSKFADPLFHILSGGVMLGAIFMATDMVTTPLTVSGMIIFGTGCGIITMMIRIFGAYPEGVSFSILIMNALTPLIDRYTKPRRYGI